MSLLKLCSLFDDTYAVEKPLETGTGQILLSRQTGVNPTINKVFKKDLKYGHEVVSVFCAQPTGTESGQIHH